jgi:hypothetical protein
MLAELLRCLLSDCSSDWSYCAVGLAVLVEAEAGTAD